MFIHFCIVQYLDTCYRVNRKKKERCIFQLILNWTADSKNETIFGKILEYVMTWLISFYWNTLYISPFLYGPWNAKNETFWKTARIGLMTLLIYFWKKYPVYFFIFVCSWIKRKKSSYKCNITFHSHLYTKKKVETL